MGNVCEPREDCDDRNIQLQRRLEPHMSLAHYSKLKQIQQISNGHQLSLASIEKHILTVITIRQQLVDEMVMHAYICGNREIVVSYQISDANTYIESDWLERASSGSWNPQECQEETNCERGLHLNECMKLCVSNLQALKFSEIIYLALIMKY